MCPSCCWIIEPELRERSVLQVDADSSLLLWVTVDSLHPFALMLIITWSSFLCGEGFHLLLWAAVDCCSLCFLAMITCQWFFTALSVRPGKSLAIIAHLLPYTLWAANSLSSSSSVNARRLILGSSWLNHLNLQLFPVTIVWTRDQNTNVRYY